MSCRLVLLISAAAAVLVMAPAPAVAQKGKPPLTPWGKPDLQGVWDFRSLTPMERPGDLGEKAAFTSAEEAAQSWSRARPNSAWRVG
jgi:hypothetical protein